MLSQYKTKKNDLHKNSTYHHMPTHHTTQSYTAACFAFPPLRYACCLLIGRQALYQYTEKCRSGIGCKIWPVCFFPSHVNTTQTHPSNLLHYFLIVGWLVDMLLDSICCFFLIFDIKKDYKFCLYRKLK